MSTEQGRDFHLDANDTMCCEQVADGEGEAISDISAMTLAQHKGEIVLNGADSGPVLASELSGNLAGFGWNTN